MKSDSQTYVHINPDWVNAPCREAWVLAKNMTVPVHFIKVGDAENLPDYEVWEDPFHGLRLDTERQIIPKYILKNEA